MTGKFGTVGLPPDAVAWIALFLAALFVLTANHPKIPVARWIALRPRQVVLVLAACAFMLSSVYVYEYLRGGPRIIDATSYFLQGRAISSGHFAFPVPEPTGSFRGRFLVPTPDGRSLAVLFPPGYPLLLALGFLFGTPMLVGPCLGAALTIATYVLAKRSGMNECVALVAAALSVVSAAVRYHTADTMSHGFAALLAAVALIAALGRSKSAAIACGLAVGWLVATRPVTGVAVGAVSFACVGRRSLLRWALAAAAVGVTPLFVYQYAATGHFFESVQVAYYGAADGPPGCFRYGFGPAVGCRVEHGEFVRHNLPHGYGAWAAASTTLRRLKMHLLDAGNLELFPAVALLAAWFGRHDIRVRRISIGIAGLIVAYVPFYFDGNYPGGGARFYMDAIAFEHVLIAWGVVAAGAARVAVPLALFGFAVHASFEHRQLAERDGGRPMFEPRVLSEAGVVSGLLFIDTDHGFNLAHDPRPQAKLTVARLRRDAHDWLLWQRLGRPPAYRYLFDASNRGRGARVLAYRVPFSMRIESEAEWPPLSVRGGWVRPAFSPCASLGRGTEFVGEAEGPVRVELEAWIPNPGPYRLRLGWVESDHVPGTLSVEGQGIAVPLGPTTASPCPATMSDLVRLGAGPQRFTVSARSGVVFDYLDLVRWPEPADTDTVPQQSGRPGNRKMR